MILQINEEERLYLVEKLGGETSNRKIGEGFTGQDAIALRQELEALKPSDMTPAKNQRVSISIDPETSIL